MIVARRQLKTLHVQDGDVRVEECVAEPHSLNLGTQPLALLRLDEEVIHVLAADAAVHCDVERNLLRLIELAVRLFLVDVGQRANVKRAQLGNPRGGANAHSVLAQPGVGRDLHRRLHRAIVDNLKLSDREPRLVEEDFFGVREPAAVEGDRHLDTALSAAGRNAAEAWRSGVGDCPRGKRQHQRHCVPHG